MNTEDAPTYLETLALIRSWPAAKQFDLIQNLLQTLAPDRVTPEERRKALRELRGSLATNKPPPTDEDVARWLEERRLERYG